MNVDPLTVEYERIRQQLKQALSESVRDMRAASQAMDQLENVRMRLAAMPRTQGTNPAPAHDADM